MTQKKVYAIDFDGTLCVNEYPMIGGPIQEVIDYTKKIVEEGHKIILWTCRTDEKLQEAVDWCNQKGIYFDAVNENLEENIKLYGSDTRKISADHYVDDRAIKVDEIVSGKEVMRLKKNKDAQMKRLWEFRQSTKPDMLDLYIYGYVEGDSYDWWNDTVIESETSANFFRSELAKYPDVKQINIFINSYGGSVYEGTAIYNQLRRHPAQKIVHVDGFACSVASLIAMAGDKVIMPPNTMMMIHNMWTCACGNAKELRKVAEDLDVMMASNRQAYLEKSGNKLTEEQLIDLLDNETYLTAAQCLAYGFADEIPEKEVDLTQAKEMLQQVNQSLEQHLSYNKAVATMIRDMQQRKDPEPASDPVEPVEPKQKKEDPKEPENKTKKLITALFR